MAPVLSRPGEAGDCDTLQAVLFDMDGLLVDTEPLWFEVEREVMARLGGDWTQADQLALIGGSMDRSVGYLLKRATRPANPVQVADWLTTGMAALIASRQITPMPGALELLGLVRASGLPFALVTSSEPVIVNAVLASLAVHDVEFGVIVTGADVSRSKPDPEPYQLAAGRLGVDPRCCVALEDSPNGVRSARAAGCATVAVPGLALIDDLAGVHLAGSLSEIDLETLHGLIGLARKLGASAVRAPVRAAD
jgi:HAD superfamily hydrolase (TIGR01509 family)